MVNDGSPTKSLVDRQGPIRYDWSGIQLLWTAGASAADIAKSLTQDFPEQYDIVRNTVAKRAQRHEWHQTAKEAQKLVSANPSSFYNKPRELSASVLATSVNIASERKKNYVDRVAGFLDKSSKLLEDRPLESLEDAALAGKLMEPVHNIARDIHGLNAREPVAALQVNFLSDPGTWKQVEENPESEHITP